MKNKDVYRKLLLSVYGLTYVYFVQASTTEQLEAINVNATAEQKDEQGKDEVYQRNITNMYAGKETVERYKGSSPADLFQEFNGVYSGDARNSGAIDPNIRGVQGQGRIPTTIDGTEQALTTWRGYNGANNRNYIDPNLIGSITVEKGPELASGNSSGIGGAVKMRTIDADDIVNPGRRVGVELKLETSNNSVKECIPDFKWGQDYRVVGDGTPGDFSSVTLVKPNTKGKYFKDNSMRLAVGVKEDKFDLLAAYSYRSKGNYLAGNGGAHKYEGAIDEKSGRDLKQIEPNLPFAASIYRPRTEIPNTSSVMESYLLKNTVRLTDKQTLKMGYRHTKITYGEIMPSRLDFSEFHGYIPQWPLATVKQQAFNLDYAYNPDNPWINFNAGVWYTRTVSDTNTSGGNPREAKSMDVDWTLATSGCVIVNPDATNPHEYIVPDRACLARIGDPLIKANPNIGGKYSYVNAAQVNAYNTRRGLNLSNTMNLTDKLDLTISGAFQKERLTSSHFNATPNPSSTYESPPRAGRRQEWDIAFNFNYRPTNWLMLTAGARYNEYWSFDDYLDHLIKTNRLYDSNGDTVVVGQSITYQEVVSQKDWDRYQEIRTELDKDWDWDKEETIKERNQLSDELVLLKRGADWIEEGYRRHLSVDIPYRSDGRLHKEDNPFYNGMLKNEKVKNPFSGEIEDKYQEYHSGYFSEKLEESDRIKKVEKRRGHAFFPAFSATAFLNDHSRVYLRYTQYARMPSIFETTVGFSASPNISKRFKDAKLKPEKAQNIELGYVYDFSNVFNSPTKADIKLSYYHNVTKNVIDRDTEFRFVQLDKHLLEGIELQARYDNGDYFADLGIEYHLKNKVCDANTAVEMDPMQLRVPTCMTGGFAWGYLRTQLQPKYSITSNLGARFLDNKLEIGTRWLYHSKAKNKDEDRLWELKVLNGGIWNRPMSWQPVLTLDAYVKYKFSPNLTMELTGTNLTDRYYLDPMTRSMIPAPGRTLKLGITARF
ncbi:TonB-dependent receptor domain-containing protein [Rodentibacter pneumotropicus]|uniref:TonB-dependent receptor domain-containing protein n=1 Tax=Rodentibacter pneumotropicus TaxID=758 RepID=UPI0009872464|nr:TonB-dependent receptor [Rodentibacter pneumotropicus]OOF61901.1 TonB-dependent receptor [Rodentibacter pneumotropicus]THA18119.1 TonB-dependent receptor [Rodentibacter pneumotropicus]